MELEAVKVFGDSITVTVGVCNFVTSSCVLLCHYERLMCIELVVRCQVMVKNTPFGKSHFVLVFCVVVLLFFVCVLGVVIVI